MLFTGLSRRMRKTMQWVPCICFCFRATRMYANDHEIDLLSSNLKNLEMVACPCSGVSNPAQSCFFQLPLGQEGLVVLPCER